MCQCLFGTCICFVGSILLLVHVSLYRTLPHWTPYTLPNPVTSFEYCGVDSSSFICDPDLLLNQTQKEAVQTAIDKVYNGDPPFGQTAAGHQVAVLVIGFYSYPAYSSESFARNVHDIWNLGEKGVLVLWAKYFYELHIVAGSGVPQLNSAAKEYIVKVRERRQTLFDDGEYLEAVVSEVGNFIAGTKVMKEDKFGQYLSYFIAFLLVIHVIRRRMMLV